MILSASRAADRTLKAPSNPSAAAGLRFERSVVKALRSAAPTSAGFSIEHNPWFVYRDSNLTDYACCPDILIHDIDHDYIIVVEVKLTWVPNALEKLQKVYCPVVARALESPTRPVIVVRNLTPDSPRPQPSITRALLTQNPVVQWFDPRSPIPF